MAEKMVIVPQRMLDNLETARKQLYAMYPPDIAEISTTELVELTEISDPMWKLANTKWEESKS
jgi:hypothetical protein